MRTSLKVRKLADGQIQAARLDGRPLTDEDRQQALLIAEGEAADNPILAVGDWYLEFRAIHRRVVSETPSFSYAWVRANRPDLHQAIKALEDRIDRLGAARLSDITNIMIEWRSLVLQAEQARQTAGGGK